MKLIIGYDESLGMGAQLVVEESDGTPVAIPGSDLELTVTAGILVIRSTTGRVVVRPESSNALAVTSEPFSVLGDAILATVKGRA